MEFREREGTTFEEAERRYAELERRYDAGEIDEEEFDTERQRLLVRDDGGRWWAKSRESGQWLYHDGGGAWIEGTPPLYRQVSSKDYSPERIEPDLLERYEPRPAARRSGGSNRLLIGLGVLSAVLAIGLIAALAYSLTSEDTTGEVEPAAEEPESVATSFALTSTLDSDNDVYSVALSPDGDLLASSGYDHLKVWDLRSGEELQTLEEHSSIIDSVAFSPDGRLLASSGIDRTVKLRNPRSGEELRTLKGHSSNVFPVVFSPDGSLLASGSRDKTVKLWNPQSGRLERTLTGHSDEVQSVAFSPDGSRLASGGDDGAVKLWNPRSGEEIRTLAQSDWVSSVAFRPDGSLLASGSHDGTVELSDLRGGKVQQTLEGHSGFVRTVAFSPDGSLLASGSYDNTVKLWDPESGEEIQTLEGHEDGVNSVAFSSDGSLLASGGYDQTVRLWERAGDASSELSASSSASSEAPSKSTPSTDRTTPATIPPALVGTWEGTIFDHDISEEYPATYVFRDAPVGSRMGNSSYPTLGCRGDLQLESVSESTVKFTERITEGSRCVSLVYLEAELVGSKLDISFRNTRSGELAGEGTVSKRE